MRPGAWLPILAGAALAAGTTGAVALEFPLEYAGTMDVTSNVTNTNGSGRCSASIAVSVILTANREVRWENLAYSLSVREPAGLPPSCEIRPGSQTVVSPGTHDGVSRLSIPTASPSLPPITATFDADHLRGSYQLGPTTLSFDLPAVTHRIALEPDPAQGFKFQESILRGRGFKIVIRDSHGRDHLDFDTLKILVGGSMTTPGVDTTAHALSRLSRGIVPVAEESSDSRTRVFKLMPDPTKLMQGHDIFAIPFNGDWRIELRICDKAGHCFGSVYQIYIGTFVRFAAAVDGRCSSSARTEWFRVGGVVIGNAGIDAPNTQIYVGLTPAAGGELWTLFFVSTPWTPDSPGGRAACSPSSATSTCRAGCCSSRRK